ncbi:hypothetical protein [Opitutus terrae]|uniref:MtrB/PioB family decaheme-associated outer membrane protein n=1 Tax=Opitutus terrae (strain DSM 11246 / JCM 15787 / PB90-1) TaxID=452637 RepID=B1ZTY2_OPITP|nr:hypothetical protein [Opitutus terrae]ACB75864.1 hypothetical protein Oter_2582 [Opitutus terrae PB90-1]
MQRFRSSLILATLLAPAALLAQTVTTSGTVSVSAGGTLLEGNRAAYQRTVQHAKQGFAGIEDFNLTREAEDSVFKFDARLLPGDEDYRVSFRFDKTDRFYIEGGYEQFRVWYNGGGGYFRPRGMAFTLFDEDLSLDRTRAWLEAGVYLPNQILLRARYEHRARNGTKDSTMWGDSNAPAPYGTRNITPSLMDLNETTNTFSVDIGNTTQEDQKWNVGGRVSETKIDDKRYSRRRPFDSGGDRIITTKDESSNDLYAAHGFYLRKVNDQLTVSGGALITKLDTVIEGSRIYGQSYDPVYDPNYARRQQRDEGFYNLEGKADVKQTVLNLNAVYTPRKDWSIRPSIRFENRRDEATDEFVEINTGPAPAVAPILEALEGENDKDWSEFTEEIEVRYTGKPNWTFNGTAEWLQGTGNLEEMLGEAGVFAINRDVDLDRFVQKYSFGANWYAKPGLTFAAQYYYKGSMADYGLTRDNTPPYGGDRYPSYIIDQDFETHDVNVRVTWRPVTQLNLVTRYDHQESKVTNVMAGLGKSPSGDYSSDIISQNVTWSPTARLFVTGSVNARYDQLATPAYPFVQNGDNNSINGSLGAGYVVSQKDDVFVDYHWFDADNYIDNSRTSLPFGLTDTQNAFYVTWVRRQTEQMIYTVKYGYVTNDDYTYGRRNDFEAHVLYAKVQYRF